MTPSPGKNAAPQRPGRGGPARAATACAAVCLLTLLGLFALAPAGASAILLRTGAGHTVSYQPLRGSAPAGAKNFDTFFSNLDYDGGPVMPSNTNYAVYWAPPGSPAYPTGYQEGLAQY